MKSLGITLQTIAELIGLVVWLTLVISGQMVIGIVFLVGGLVLEHLLAYRFLVGGSLPVGKLLGVSASEAILWIVWLVISTFDLVAGFVFLTATMVLQHSVEKNLFEGKPLFGDIFHLIVVPHTLLETVGAFIWLFFVFAGQEILGAAVFSVFILVEHIVQANLK